jgi:hypothetical protein
MKFLFLIFLNPTRKFVPHWSKYSSEHCSLTARVSKRTSHFNITKIKCLKEFKEIISVYTDNHTKPINTKYSFNIAGTYN